MAKNLSPSPKFTAFDSNGDPLVGGKLYTYLAGGTTPSATYTDSGGGTANNNPVVLDSRGEADVWLTPTLSYKFALTTSADVPIWTVDSIPGQTALVNAAFSGAATVAKNNTTDAFTFIHPDSTSATWDTSPLAAIHIDTPPTPTTRNFLAGLWVETEGASVDKGRGILVNNWGASDGIMVQTDGASGTGIASLVTAAATGATALVVGTMLSTQYGIVARQETALSATANGVPLLIEANGAVTEMMRVNSTKNSQQGIIFRMTGSASALIVGIDGSAVTYFTLNNAGSIASTGNLSFTGTGTNFLEAQVQYGANAVLANNGQTVTYNTNVGPLSASVSVQSWLKVKDNSGNQRFIPLFGA